MKHLEKHQLISDHQYGFRSSRSCGDLHSCVTHAWASSLKDHGESVAISVDISKAFDRVWHDKLLAKLPSFGIPPSTLNLIASFLCCRTFCVRVDGVASSLHEVNAGVPQGCVLSPTLFLLFINDLLESTKNPIHSYADDSTLHSSTTFSKYPLPVQVNESRQAMVDSLNDDMARISQWGLANSVRFNSSKTQSITFSLKKPPLKPDIMFEGELLTPSDRVNLLGLSFTEDLSWKSHIATLARSASQKLGVLYRCRSYFTCKQLLTLYKGTIRPCMEYSCHVWGSSPGVDLIDRVQRKAVRLISENTLTNSIPPLSHRRKIASLSLFYRYYHGHCSTELHDCVPPPLPRPRSTRQASVSHSFSVDRSQHCRIERYQRTFIPQAAHLWNDLPGDLFPPTYDPSLFKKRINGHLLART